MITSASEAQKLLCERDRISWHLFATPKRFVGRDSGKRAVKSTATMTLGDVFFRLSYRYGINDSSIDINSAAYAYRAEYKRECAGCMNSRSNRS